MTSGIILDNYKHELAIWFLLSTPRKSTTKGNGNGSPSTSKINSNGKTNPAGITSPSSSSTHEHHSKSASKSPVKSPNKPVASDTSSHEINKRHSHGSIDTSSNLLPFPHDPLQQQQRLIQYQHQQHQSPKGASAGGGGGMSKSMVNHCVEILRRLHIKLIAFDFDCTIVSVHTGGQWLDTAEKLAEFVRPCFRDLLPALLHHAHEFHVCVVTYSPQEQLIREVLRLALRDEPNV